MHLSHTCHVFSGCPPCRAKCFGPAIPARFTERHRSFRTKAAAEFAVDMDELEDNASEHSFEVLEMSSIGDGAAC